MKQGLKYRPSWKCAAGCHACFNALYCSAYNVTENCEIVV